MLTRFLDHTRCPGSLVEKVLVAHGSPPAGQSNPMAEPASGLEKHKQFKHRVDQFLQSQNSSAMSWDTNLLLDELRLERYIDNRIPDAKSKSPKSIVRNLYYFLRPAFPVAFRKQLQRVALRGWERAGFPAWPVDFTADDVIEKIMRQLLEAGGMREFPLIWYWPDGKPGACMMTHDVETGAGRDFCRNLMEMEAEFGIVSSFEIVPEQRYEVPEEVLGLIRKQGCEVCVHGLNHDGHLFSSETTFRQRAPKINEYARAWKAVGFRSPVMYRNLNWYSQLNFLYDMSVPNVGHLDPQRGGCCTVMPYFIDKMVELPLTTTQDYPLYNILNQRTVDLWQKQSRLILQRHGLISFIIHPDYTIPKWARQLYRELLASLAELRSRHGVWLALPREIAEWWRQRHQMELYLDQGRWRIRGQGAHRARIAYASLEGGRIKYRVEQSPA